MSYSNHEPNLIDDIMLWESVRIKIKQHEENLIFLYSQSNAIADSILDLQVSLGRYHSANAITSQNGNGTVHTEDDTVEQIMRIEKSSAGLFSWLNANNLTANLAFAEDTIGVVATLAKVESDDLSTMLSEFLGLRLMLAIVCSTTRDGFKAFENYDSDGEVNSNADLHGLGSSIARSINGRFDTICLEDILPFAGGNTDDAQKTLAIRKPRLPNGECPPGFLDYAVNMLHLDPSHLSYVTAGGHGLRETLFYSLFSRLQVYKTRKEMNSAIECIDEGAVSLDGGMIRNHSVFVTGSRKEVEVRFPLISGESDVPPNYREAEDKLRKLKWEKSKFDLEIQREQKLLDSAKIKITSHL